MRFFTLSLTCLIISFSAFCQTDIVIGNGTTGNGGTTYPCPLQDYFEGSRMQYLFLASELSAAGMTAGNISAIKFDVANLNTFSGSVEQLKMAIGNTSTSSLTSNSWETGLTDVFGPVDDTVLLGTNTFTFSTPFFWNGSDNIVVEVCNGDPNNSTYISYTQNPTINWTTGLTFNASHSYRADNLGNLCGTSNTTNTGTQTTRPNITFSWTAASTTGCYVPSGITITNITSTGADASWNPPASGVTPLQYMWELRTSGAPGSGATGLVASNATATTTANFSALIPITTYKFYIKSDCGSSNMSIWSGAYSFMTACAAITAINENFDGVGTATLPVCWSKILRGSTLPAAAYVQTATGNAVSAPNAISMYNSSATATDEIILVTPQLSNAGAGTYRLTFYAKNSAATEDIEVGTLDDNTSTANFTPLELVDINTTYAKYAVSFAAYTGTDQYIGIRRLNTTTFSYVYLDNLVWELIPACQEVTGLMHSIVTATSAQLDWTAPASGNTPVGYHIYYATNRTPPTDVTIPVDSSLTATYNMTSLLPATKYFIWVRSKCGGGSNSPWSVVDSLVTDCVPITSFNENFDGVGTATLPVCWSKILRGATIPAAAYVQTATGNAYSTPNAITLYNSNAGLTDDIILVSPNLSNLAAGTYQLTFYAKNSTASQDVEVGTLDNNTSTAVFSPLQTVDLGTTYQKYTVSFSTYTGTDTYIGIRRAAATLSTFSYVYIDNATWSLIPSCIEPTALSHASVDTNSAVISWTPPTTSTPVRYHIYYSTSSTAPVATTNPNDSVTTTTYTMTGLLAATKYYVWVRSHCGGGDVSIWTNTDSFFTASPNYVWATLSGFNNDVIADGIGDASTSTSNDVDNVSYVLVAADYQYDNTCPKPVQNLPLSRQIYHNSIPGLYFQMPPYNGDNDLRLSGTDVGTLTLATPIAAEKVYLLALSGSGASRIDATVNFSDGSTQTFTSLDILDWFGATTNMVTGGIGRLLKTTTACGGLETSTTNPKLYQVLLTLDPGNYAKTVASVTISRIDGVTGFAGIPNIFAITVKKSNMVLPVALVDFSGYRTEKGNTLIWQTKSESNNKGFEIQRSADGKNFSTIAFAQSKAEQGNSTQSLSYTFTDAAPLTVTSYYRLKQMDKDGKYVLSNIVVIKGIRSNTLLIADMYPNPAKNKLNIVFNAPTAGKITILITDAVGKTVMQHKAVLTSGDNMMNFNIESLQPGYYMVKAVCDNGCETAISKLIKQ